MNIQHLKYAVEVAKTGSVSKTAETLYINQPNLSRAIRELEGSLGITLFERSAKGMTSTREGREFLRNAEKVLAELDEIENYYKKGAAAKTATQSANGPSAVSFSIRKAVSFPKRP